MPAVSTGSCHAGGAAGPRIVVTVGTDHHPFDRLIAWTNDWVRGHRERTGLVFAQYGTSRVRPECPGEPMLPAGRLAGLLDRADVVVCHGGPGTIAEAWRRGHLPVVVPRRRRLGEHVDDHQVEFCAMLAGHGHIRLARTPEELGELVLQAAAEGRAAGPRGPVTDTAAAVERFAALVDALIDQPRRLRRRGARGAGSAGTAPGHPRPAPGPVAQAPASAPNPTTAFREHR